MKKHTLFSLFAVLVFFLIGCEEPAKSQPPPPPPPKAESLRIGYSKLRISLPIFVAKEKGYFAEQGLDVTLEPYDTAQPLVQALLDGKVDVGGYSALPISLTAIQKSGKSLHFSTLLVEDEKHRISSLLVPSAGSIKAVADLKGKRIGILPTIAYRVWLQKVLEANGVLATDVTIEPMDPTQQAGALKSGGIDALFTNDPVATAVKTAGIGKELFTEPEVPKYVLNPLPFGSFNFRSEWIQSHKLETAKIVKALDKAINFINTHPDEANVLMTNYLAENFRAHVKLYPHSLYVPSLEAKPKLIEASEYYSKNGLVPNAPNLETLAIDASP